VASLTSRESWRRRFLRAAGAISPPTGQAPAIRRVALVRPDHLGDVILAEPAIQRLRAALPVAAIDLWVGPWSAPVAHGIEGITVRVLPFPGFERAPKRSVVDPYRTLVKWTPIVWNERYDAAILLRFDHWWGGMLAALARIPIRLGYDQPDLAPFLTHRLRCRAGRHETLQNARLVDGLIRLAGQDPPETPPPRPCLRFVDEAPLDLPERFAVFHPGAGSPVKRWRPGGYAELAGVLRERGLDLVVTGSAGEAIEVAETVAAVDGRAVAVVGKPLPMVAAALRRARVVVGPDSGILHLASAVGTPTVRLYGPVDHRAFGPWADPTAIAVVSPFLCAPCNRLDWTAADVPMHPCIHDIRVERVIAALESVLDR
jgi:heptosyltransferase-2/heptosyltransferase-3